MLDNDENCLKIRSFKWTFFGLLLIILSFIIYGVLLLLFTGENSKWSYLAIIPLGIGIIIIIIDLIKFKNEVEARNSLRSSESSPNEKSREIEMALKPFNQIKIILIVIIGLVFVFMIILALLGKIEWTEILDAIL